VRGDIVNDFCAWEDDAVERAQCETHIMAHRESLKLQTNGHGHMVDLTRSIEEVVARSGVGVGLANIFVVGSTAAIGAIEFEPGLQRDLPEMLDRLIPPSRNYGHEQTWHDGNGHSHLQATMLGQSLTVPVESQKALLGTWQQIILLECDTRPRTRQVIVTVLG
jgi:secondary thiamine-phosphate synthase enzyme